MTDAMVYLSAIGFALTIFPVHLYNYIYLNTEQKYAGINIGIYRFINFFNANTVKDKPGEMQVNGKSKKVDIAKIRYSAYKIFNSLCLYKIIQLGDFGIREQNNAYVALAQNALTMAIYKFIQINENYTKLRNYTVFNEEHDYVRYYCKAVTIINLFVAGKIFLILIMEKIHAKNKEKQGV